MSILYCVIGWAYLAFILYWCLIKRDAPQFLHGFYYDQKDASPGRQSGDFDALGFVRTIILVSVAIAAYFAVEPLWLDDTGGAGPVFGSWLVLTAIMCVIVADRLHRTFSHYAITVKGEEKKKQIQQAYGVKEWATVDEIRKRLSTGKPGDTVTGIHIGEGMHWNEKGHMLCVGGSGQGKGVNLVLPALLSDGLIDAGISVVCLDPKGENAAVTAPHFIKRGYNVHVLNPFGIAEIADLGNSRFNPLNYINPAGNDATKLYDMLAMALHNRKGQGDNSFFDNRCRQYISLYISYAHHTGATDWAVIYKWLTIAGERRKELLAAMALDPTFDGADTAEAISDRLTGDAAKTEENIYSTIEEAVNILKDKRLRDSLSDSDFDLRTVANQPTAIFICIPFEELGYYAAWVRMFFSSLLRTLTRYYNTDHKVLVLLDEFPQLSYMDEVVRSLAVLRGYNVTLWPIVQSLAQLKSIYKEDWELFLSSAIVKHWLSNGADNFTAEYITKRMPQAIKFIGNNSDGSPREIQTKLLDHNDVINFPLMICELSNLSQPIRFKKIPYWDHPFCKNNASKNPFYKI